MGFYNDDRAGDAAVANVLKAGFDSVAWHVEKPKWVEKWQSVSVKIFFRDKGKNTEYLSFTFKVEELKRLLTEKGMASKFAIVNALGGVKDVKGEYRFVIENAFKKRDFQPETEGYSEKFRLYESILKEVAIREATEWWTKQFLGWDDFTRRNRAS